MTHGPEHAAARDVIWSQWGTHPNVHSVGLGYRETGGEATTIPAVVIGVARKYPAALLADEDLLPRTVVIDGATVEVDVLRIKPFRLAALDKQYRPSFPGASVAAVGNTTIAGTLGAVVTHTPTGKTGLLSCAHVLASPSGPFTGQAVLQPPWSDGGTEAASTIANVAAFSPILNGSWVDAAVATVASPSGLTSSIPAYLMTAPTSSQPAVGMIVGVSNDGVTCIVQPIADVLTAVHSTLPGGSAAMTTAAVGDSVQKFGRTTAYTSSKVAQVGVTLIVDGGPWGQVVMTNVLIVPAFAMPGDSGALVCKGGSGVDTVSAPQSGCLMILDIAGSRFNIPDILNYSDQADQIRDQWMTSFALGEIFVGMYYANQNAILSRVNTPIDAMSASTKAYFQSHANSYYTKYSPRILAALANPSSTDTFTSDDFGQLQYVLDGINNLGDFFTDQDLTVADNYLTNVIQPCIGMTFSQIQAYMSTQSVYLASMNSLSQQTSFTLDPSLHEKLMTPPGSFGSVGQH